MYISAAWVISPVINYDKSLLDNENDTSENMLVSTEEINGENDKKKNNFVWKELFYETYDFLIFSFLEGFNDTTLFPGYALKLNYM